MPEKDIPSCQDLVEDKHISLEESVQRKGQPCAHARRIESFLVVEKLTQLRKFFDLVHPLSGVTIGEP